MNQTTRVERISQIIEKNKNSPYGKQDILWKGNTEHMSVYQIPLEDLIYNKYNGRILSGTKTLESQGKVIDPETDEGKKIIEGLLWNSKKNRNETTLKDISANGQLKVGIITLDGIVIDGNRRVMILNKLGKTHFIAVVLPARLEDEQIEIEKLETTYQMGEDEKLSYNPIEKYLKAEEIYKKLIVKDPHEDCIKTIADWMGEEKTEIEKWLEIVKLIDDYLANYSYEGVYAMADTLNDGKEDLFLFLNKWLKTFYNIDASNKGFDGYQKSDVDDLKLICFDYIRAKIGKSYDGKDFRIIADGNKNSHFFGNKVIWKSFCEKHFAAVTPAIKKINEEYPIDYDSENLVASLSDRDVHFRDEVLDSLKTNIEEHQADIYNTKAKDQPRELLKRASNALEAIDTNNRQAFSKLDVLEDIGKLIDKLTSMLKDKSPVILLEIAWKLLSSIEVDDEMTDIEVIRTKIKEIEKIAYMMEKEVRA